MDCRGATSTRRIWLRCVEADRRLRAGSFIMRFAGFLILGALAVGGCSRPAPDAPAEQRRVESAAPSQTPSPAAPAPRKTQIAAPTIDACALLTKEEIAEVQGSAVTSTTPSTHVQNSMAVAQCYFALPTSSDSLSLIVYKKPSAGEAAPRELWKQMFHTERPAKTGRDGKPKAQLTPQKIEGVGDEAFWGGGQFGGTLHVLKGEDLFQLSIGGPGDEAKKLEALKQLATKIAERL